MNCKTVSRPSFLEAFRKHPYYGSQEFGPHWIRTKSWADAFLHIRGQANIWNQVSVAWVCPVYWYFPLRFKCCLGLHPLPVEPQYPELSLGLHFSQSPFPAFSWLPLIPGWKICASPSSGHSNSWSALLHSGLTKHPLLYSPQKTANIGEPMLTEGLRAWSQITAQHSPKEMMT